jgi:fructose 1,6-bisphosphatase
MSRKKKAKKNNFNASLTRTDKLAAIKFSNETDIVKNVDLYSCSDDELNKLYTIVSNQKKGIGRSASEWQFVNQLKEKTSNHKPVGKFS